MRLFFLNIVISTSMLFAVDFSMLKLPIAHNDVKSIPIQDSKEEMIDLATINHPRIESFIKVCPDYKIPYPEYSKVRKGLYEKLEKMLTFLPKDIGIAYAEGYRPLYKQKEYFDQKFQEILKNGEDLEKTYDETCKHVSPFIENIPTHCTGAAIDMSLYDVKTSTLLDMGKFDTIYGYNDQEETFSKNITKEQEENRMIFLKAASKAGLVNYGFEWWHYSYGDKAWAYTMKTQHAIYGLYSNQEDPLLHMKKEDYFKSYENQK